MKIVLSNNSFARDGLREGAFRVFRPEPVFVDSGDAALTAVRDLSPQLAILDAELPGLSGYQVCQAIKADAKMRSVRVILVMHDALEASQLEEAAACGCDDVVIDRDPGENLYAHVALLLGLPEARLEQPVAVRVGSAALARDLGALATRLSTSGAELLMDEPVAIGAALDLEFRRAHDDARVRITGTVSVAQPEATTGRWLATVVFDQPSPEAAARLADLALWDSRPTAEGMQIALRGRFDESVDFSAISLEGVDDVTFDVSGVDVLNSRGARDWIMFLRALPEQTSYRFVNASSEFIKHCNMLTDIHGRGAIVSFYVPYECRDCGRETQRLFRSSSVTESIRQRQPRFRCETCGGSDEFADLPDLYFSFLLRS